DGYRLSTYFYKDKDSKGGKITMGPAWDYDIAFRNANYCSGDLTEGWAFEFPCADDWFQGPAWWSRLLEDAKFTDRLKCRWQELRATAYSNAALFATIDSLSGKVNEAQIRNFQRWPILNQWVWPNTEVTGSYHAEIDLLRNFLTERLAWLDIFMPGICTQPKENESPFYIFPNPAAENMLVAANHTKFVELRIVTLGGRTIHKIRTVAINEYNLPVGNLPPGMYFLEIITVDKRYVQKFVKN
ncbi:MAG TPA: spore coat protein CotH, partial [Bacteroidales bacterium]|nr:spore coat protein CotH [Bacteroidales bacterium]